MNLALQFLAWLGVLCALAVSAIAVIAVIGALLYMALSPVLEDIGAWYRRRKILKVTARYTRRFPVLLVLAEYRGRS